MVEPGLTGAAALIRAAARRGSEFVAAEREGTKLLRELERRVAADADVPHPCRAHLAAALPGKLRVEPEAQGALILLLEGEPAEDALAHTVARVFREAVPWPDGYSATAFAARVAYHAADAVNAAKATDRAAAHVDARRTRAEVRAAEDVLLTADAYESSITPEHQSQAPFVGRGALLVEITAALGSAPLTLVVGAGGLGKTRLTTEAARRLGDRPILFLDDRAEATLESVRRQLAGLARPVVVIDNAHRREDLRTVVGALERSIDRLGIVLIARPGFTDRLASAVDGARCGPLTAARHIEVTPLSGAEIGDLIRAAQPTLPHVGAVDTIIGAAEGNPQIALLGHGAVHRGVHLGRLGRDELLIGHVDSLLAPLLQHASRADEIRDLLALASALAGVDAGDEAIMSIVDDLLGLKRRETRHLLMDVADAGLLTQLGSVYVIKPDLLAEHLLWASFFSPRPHAALTYREVWSAFWSSAAEGMCKALGGLPHDALAPHHDAAREIQDTLCELATAQPVRALVLVRQLAPGLPAVAERVVDVALDRLQHAGIDREAALAAAGDVLDRHPDFVAGYSRMLGVAQALWAFTPSPEPAKFTRERLTRVYHRLPSRAGPEDGRILAEVQLALIDVVTSYWAHHRGEPGAAEAVGIAACQMLTLSFDRTSPSSEHENQVVLRHGVVPATPATREVLGTGVTLFAETLPHLQPAFALEQLARIGHLRGVGHGRGAFGTPVPAEVATLAAETLSGLALAVVGGDLPVLVRSAATDALGACWPRDAELREHRVVFPGDHEDATEGQLEAHARAAAARLIGREGAEILQRWSGWLREIRRANATAYGSTWTIARFLDAAAESDPVVVAGLLRMLADEDSPLLDGASAALLTCLEAGDEELARVLACHAHWTARRAAAFALARCKHGPGRRYLPGLAEDPERSVREAVTFTYGADRTESWRLTVSLQACLPADLRSLDRTLRTLARGHDARAGLAGPGLEVARAVVIGSAQERRVAGYHLGKLLDTLRPALPRLAMEWAWERVAWLRTFDDADDLDRTSLAPEPFPDDIVDQLADAAVDEDRIRLLDRLEAEPEGWRERGALRALLALTDRGSTVVTDRIARWLRHPDSTLAYEANLALEHPTSWQAFTARARTLLGDRDIDIAEQLIAARDPRFWTGSLVPHHEELRDCFIEWTRDDDPRLAAIGRSAVVRLEQLVARETA